MRSHLLGFMSGATRNFLGAIASMLIYLFGGIYMKRVLSIVYSVLLVGFISFVGWTGFFAPASAAPAQEGVIGPDSQEYATREDAYDEALKVVNDPKGLDKEFKKDVEIFKEENPDKKDLVSGADNIVEEAKNVVEKVTGKE